MERSLRISIRSATAVDYDHFVRFFTELGVDDPVPTESHWRANQQAKTLIVEHDNHPIGYGFAEALDDVGYVRQIVVDPAYRRQRACRPPAPGGMHDLAAQCENRQYCCPAAL